MDMPNELRTGLARELATVPRNRLVSATAELSRRYRTRDASSAPMVRSAFDVAAYLAYRLPATFAAIHAALAEARDRCPGWQPRSLLDVGAGPGTAAWAAATVWPTLERVTLVERDADMIACGKRLMATAGAHALRTATWQMTDVYAAAIGPTYDLVVAAYLLGELPTQHLDLLRGFWDQAGGMLVLIEPGTPQGFAQIRTARDYLLGCGALTIAPCPHDHPCPMGAGDWCHFAQRTNRSALHRAAKGVTLSYEDEKYAYAAMARMQHDAIGGRVIRHPIVHPGHIEFALCTTAGLTRMTVTRKNAAAFRAARHLRWGAVAPPAIMTDDERGTSDKPEQ